MIPSTANRPKRYTERITTKLTPEQYREFTWAAQTHGQSISERLRSLAIEDIEHRQPDLSILMELLQVLRAELRTLGKIDRRVSLLAEAVAKEELAAFLDRRKERQAHETIES